MVPQFPYNIGDVVSFTRDIEFDDGFKFEGDPKKRYMINTNNIKYVVQVDPSEMYQNNF